MSEFKAGDVVQLKSGGPVMTAVICATSGTSDECVRAMWFCESVGEYKFEDFFESVLVKRADQA